MGEEDTGTTADGERKSGLTVAADYGGPAGIAATDEGVGAEKPSNPTE